jgi:hypothetical protein
VQSAPASHPEKFACPRKAQETPIALTPNLVIHRQNIGELRKIPKIVELSAPNRVKFAPWPIETCFSLRRAACQVLPLMRLGEGAQALDASLDYFPDQQENTSSIFYAARGGLRRQMEVCFYSSKNQG